MAVNSKSNRLFWLLIFLPYILLLVGVYFYNKKIQEINNSKFIIIDKGKMTLSLYDYKGNLIQMSGVATGKSSGNKNKIGDLKTPEGVFRVSEIQDASTWTHDFKDDTLGVIKGAYGPFFIRLEVPGQKGIGIHGTHDSNSIGTKASEGCIRMKNDDVTILSKLIRPSTVVVVIPGIEDIKSNIFDSLKVDLNLKEKKKLLK